ncbi:MAG: pyridoxamine 5'-phosphate oxidase family protein [Nocardiopsaceae bacterium]|nr:pyridoxamine 5'-phosphate oxidase family protein [Nocardiopsaceae bacterium]
MTYGDGLSHTGSDIGRRAAQRRRELGLTRAEVAELAEMDPGYVAYLEEHPSQMTRQALDRLARALHTTPEHLLGADTDLPPGSAATAIPTPELYVLDPQECMRLIAPGGVGRIAFMAEGETTPTVLPVNYVVADRTIVFRTADQGVIADHVPGEVGFEVDQLDITMSQGWSVLVAGSASLVSDADELADIQATTPVRPWANGERNAYVRITPTSISGRRIRG